MYSTCVDLVSLRRAMADMDKGTFRQGSDLFRLGPSELDSALGGGLAKGALHEVYACRGLADAAAAGGFGLGLALLAGIGRPLLWVRHDFVEVETGTLYGAGLSAFGLDPARLILVRTRDPTDALRAAAEAAVCPAVGAVLAEIWGEPCVLDLTTSRRLARTAGRSGVTLILIRLAAAPVPSAAASRWIIEAAPSLPLDAKAPGGPAFAATLVRHKSGAACRTWHMEWNCECFAFNQSAPLSRPLVSVPASRPVSASTVALWRRTA